MGKKEELGAEGGLTARRQGVMRNTGRLNRLKGMS